MTPGPWWQELKGSELAQGDFLLACVVPMMPADFTPPAFGEERQYQFDGDVYDLIVVTQSCDLVFKKAPLVACCPIFSLEMYERVVPAFKQKGRWEEVRQGRREGLHMLASISEPMNSRQSLIVDFRQIYSLPIGYLSNLAASKASRMRLNSPYLEHFSQAFARFFMRVGLPSTIPDFR